MLRQADFNGRVARKKPCINEINRKKRKSFARELISKTWWKDVFAEESKFNLYNSDGRTMVWWKANKEFNLENTRGTVKHGRGSVIVWGCISSYGTMKPCVAFRGEKNSKVKYLGMERMTKRSGEREEMARKPPVHLCVKERTFHLVKVKIRYKGYSE